MKYEVIIYWSEEDGRFIAEVPELPGCMADGATYTEALSAAEAAAAKWIETARAKGRKIPEPRRWFRHVTPEPASLEDTGTVGNRRVRLHERDTEGERRALLLDCDCEALSSAQQVEVHNDLAMLHALSIGIQRVVMGVFDLEERLKAERLDTQELHSMMAYAHPMVSFSFQVYSVAMVNFAWLVGAVLNRLGIIQETPKDYRDRVVGGAVIAFRNKVGAHFAAAAGSNRDNDAERITSVIAGHVLLIDGEFYAPSGVLHVANAGGSHKSDACAPFSVRQHYARMWRRYWLSTLGEDNLIPLLWRREQATMQFLPGSSGSMGLVASLARPVDHAAIPRRSADEVRDLLRGVSE